MTQQNKYLVLFAFSYLILEPFPKMIEAELVQLQQQFTIHNLLKVITQNLVFSGFSDFCCSVWSKIHACIEECSRNSLNTLIMFGRNLCYRWIFSTPLFNQESGVCRKIKRYTQLLQLTQHFKTTTKFAEHKTAL